MRSGAMQHRSGTRGHAAFGLRAPLKGVLREYRRAWLRRDLLAGVTVFALLVPSALAYGALAGLAPVAGLYTALAAMIAYALFGSSRQLIIGPDAALPLMIAATIGPLAAGNLQHYAVLVATTSLLVGMICVAAALCHVGFVASFVARPILTGYLIGIALIVIVSQLGRLLGITLDSDTMLGQVWEAWTRRDEAHPGTLAIGAASIAGMLAIKRFVPRLPGPLLAMIATALMVNWWNLDQHGVAVVGAIPAGLPRPVLPTLSAAEVRVLLLPAASIALLSFADEIVTARSFATRNNYEIDADQELLGLGAADIACGLLGGFPVSASSARTAVVDSVGGRTQLVGLIAAGLLILFLCFFTTLLANLPLVVLAAVLIVAVSGLIDMKELRRLYVIRRSEFFLAVVTMVAVVTIGLLEAILVAVVLAVVSVLGRLVRPHDAVLVSNVETNGLREIDIAATNDLEVVPGVIIYRFDAPLFFANASSFVERARALIATSQAPVAGFVLDAESITDLDSTAADSVAHLLGELQAKDIHIVVARASAPLREMLRRTGLAEQIGEEQFFPLLSSAVAAFATKGQH